MRSLVRRRLLVSDCHVSVDRLPGSGGADDEHDPHAVHVDILKEWCPSARLEDVEIFGIEIFRVWMADVRGEDGRQARMVVLGQPQREDIEFMVAGEHRVERGEIAQRLFHHLCPCIDEDPMHSRGGVAELFGTASRKEQPERIFSLGLLVEVRDDFTEVIDVDVRGSRARRRFDCGRVAGVHYALQDTDLEKGDELLLLVDLAARRRSRLRTPLCAQDTIAVQCHQAGKEARPRCLRRGLRENIWTWRLPTCRWSLCQATGLFTICRSISVSPASWA
jgi:hypothetical protein